MSLKLMLDTDLCETCLGFVAYGTTGDYAATGPRSEEQTSEDHRWAEVMATNLGVIATDFDSSDDVDGSFSHYGCDGCGRTQLHVYNGTVAYERETDSE